MPEEYDISNFTLDEIEPIVNGYDPYSANDSPLFTSSQREPAPDTLTDEQMKRATDFYPAPDVLNDEEMFDAGDYSIRSVDGNISATATERAYKAVQKAKDLPRKVFWKSMGILSWPFERLEYGIGTPLTQIIKTIGPVATTGRKFTEEMALKTPLGKSIYKNKVRDMLSPYSKAMLGEEKMEQILDDLSEQFANGWLTHDEIMSSLTESKAELKGLLPSLWYGAKSFIPFTRNDPEKVKNFNDFWAAYYEEITGEKSPGWLEQTAGIGTGFLTTPFIFGKIIKGLRIGTSKLPFVQKALKNKLPEWADAKLMRKAGIYERNERAAELGKRLADKDVQRAAYQLSLKSGKQISKEAVKLRLGQIIKGSITQQGVLKEAANPVIDELEKNFKELQKLGIISDETYLTKLTKARILELNTKKAKLTKQLNRLLTAPHYVGTPEISAKFPGRAKKIRDLQQQIESIDDSLWKSTHFGGSGQLYMPRMYLTKEAEIAEARKFPLKGGPKIRAPYAKARKDIPFEERKRMMEIMEPEYPVQKRLIQEAMDIETSKLFDFASKQGAWVDDIWRPGLYETPLPDTKAYGALAGKYVHPKIYNDITELTHIRRDFESIYDSMIGTWKTGKVVLNPATHFRNIISNSILLDLSGMDHVQQVKFFIKSLREIRNNGEEYKTAKKFMQHTTMMSGEMIDDLLRIVETDKSTGLQKSINNWNKIFEKATGAPRLAYQEEEFIFKFMKYLEQREKGMSVIKSVREANKWLFDYSDLSLFEKRYMRRVMPFYTFPRKALPRVLEAAEKRPLTLAKYPLMAWAEEKYALHKLEMTDEDYEDVKKILPDYMKRGSYMLMPFRDQNGKLMFFDWTYILPWGELYDVQDRGLLGTVVSNPFIQVTADITRNRSGFSGREIWKETDTFKERSFKKMLHLWQTAVPSLMYKGIYWDKLYRAATGKPSKMGDVEPVAPAVAHTIFGARTTAIDPEEQAQYRLYEKMRKAEELEAKILDITIRATNNNITEEEYNEKREQYIQQINELFSEEESE